MFCAGFTVKRESELLFFISERKAVCSAESIFEFTSRLTIAGTEKRKPGFPVFRWDVIFFVVTSFVYSVSVFASG